MLKEIDQMNTVSSMNRKNVRRRRPKALALIGMGVTLAIALIVGAVVVVLPRLTSHAAVVNPNCSLFVPNNPLSAQGLATPYQLTATDPAGGPCNEANTGQSAFVQATILDPATGALSAYEPLVVDRGTKPAVQPVVPTLPANAVVGIWFGFNGTILHLRGGGLRAGNCVNGTPGSNFGQFAYCNAPAFFTAANAAIGAGKLTIPALGTGTDGLACPSVRDFGIVDMDQSDNVQTQYLVNANGQTAQVSTANMTQLPNATKIGNPSDNALVSKILDPVLGCTPFTVPDLANPGTMTPTLAADELEAAADQQAPVALVPSLDEMVLVNGNTNLNKINRYRVGVDQTPAATLNDANTTTYCQNIINVQLPRLNKDQTLFQNQPSPDAGATATTLFNFLANRLNATLGAGGLNCLASLKINNPITLTLDGNGVVTAATVAPNAVPAGTGTSTGNGGTTTGAGGVQQVATGGATIALDTNAGNADVALNITYPNHPNQQINVNLVPSSCTGTATFTQVEDTDGNGQNDANTVVNGLQGLTALPNGWFFTVTDPQQNNMVVGCGSVTATGVNGTATLGIVNAVPAVPTATPASANTNAAVTPTATVTP